MSYGRQFNDKFRYRALVIMFVCGYNEKWYIVNTYWVQHLWYKYLKTT